MRSLFTSLALAVVFLVPQFVAAQTSASDLREFEADCQAVGKTYSQVTRSCVAMGGSASGNQGSVNTVYLEGYKNAIINIINGIIVPVLMAIAFLMFLWGVYKYYIYHGDSDSERETGHKFILWGVIGFVVLFSVWGLVNLVGSTLNLNQAGSTPREFPRI